MQEEPKQFIAAPGQKMLIIEPSAGQHYGLGDWHTHLPLLSAALMGGKPSTILELGAGDYSTRLINVYARTNPEAHAISVENDFYPGWYEGLTHLVTKNHAIRLVDDWDYQQWEGDWDLVFIDHGPESERIPAADYFSMRCKMMMLHDCNYPVRYQQILDRFKYVVHDQTHRFFTCLASNEIDVTTWFE